MKLLFSLVAISLSAASAAQMSPIGTWRSIDDATKEAKAEIVIGDNGGVLSGKISKLLRKDAPQDSVCTECTDDRKGKAIIGLEIIRGAKKTEGKDVWEGGKILDAESGKNYTLKMTPIDGGAKLDVRGSILFVGRTQTWVRVQ
jgi:uncharacterized protein (DUF2147 family)